MKQLLERKLSVLLQTTVTAHVGSAVEVAISIHHKLRKNPQPLEKAWAVDGERWHSFVPEEFPWRRKQEVMCGSRGRRAYITNVHGPSVDKYFPQLGIDKQDFARLTTRKDTSTREWTETAVVIDST